jgi:hypothetical protein
MLCDRLSQGAEPAVDHWTVYIALVPEKHSAVRLQAYGDMQANSGKKTKKNRR